MAGSFRGVENFDVSIKNGCIVLAPVEIQKAGAHGRAGQGRDRAEPWSVHSRIDMVDGFLNMYILVDT